MSKLSSFIINLIFFHATHSFLEQSHINVVYQVCNILGYLFPKGTRQKRHKSPRPTTNVAMQL